MMIPDSLLFDQTTLLEIDPVAQVSRAFFVLLRHLSAF